MRTLLLLCMFVLAPAAWAAPVALFDGKSLDGWEGDAEWWSVQDGLITGGSATQKVPKNFFMATRKSYQNFDLRLQLRLTGDPKQGMINSGIQIRSVRVPGSTEMSGYQVDAGEGWWGKLYDESRRNKVIAEAADLKAAQSAVKPGDWNELRILAEGSRIRSWINGVPALDYTEKEAQIAQNGHIGIQVHSGGNAVVQVKEITIEELPADPAAPTWEKVGRPQGHEKKQAAAAPKPLKNHRDSDIAPNTPEQQLATFKVPDGFEVELVAAEDEAAGVGKFVAVYFDERGRMWSMTALEYPVDGNENPQAAQALYASKGKDKLLVFDTPFAPGKQTPRVYADGLAIPLGILPYRGGCYALHGQDIVYLRDEDGDGRADAREVILTGFGVQDSHLFPHQFTRAPGGWLWMAQGAFNYSRVRRPNDAPERAIQFDQTRMAKFRPDGSQFDITSNGPCNIWGLVMNAEGESFIQEANDFGYCVMPFHEYANYPGCSNGQWKSYAPEFPSISPFRVGGTGLSGLALTDAQGAFPEPWADVMLIANPITRVLNAVKLKREGTGWSLQQLPDFLTSTDPMFRPVALTLGPDGCVYIVDWYNKIISHNEVPRSHPERDKVRGRIWRVKAKTQGSYAGEDLTKLSPQALVDKLGGPSLAQSHLVWQTLADRPAQEVQPLLEPALSDEGKSAAARIQALWVLSESGKLALQQVEKLFQSPNRNLRREAVRAWPQTILSAGNPTNLEPLRKLAQDADPEVRAEVIRGCGFLLDHAAETKNAPLAGAAISVILTYAQAPLDSPVRASTHTGKPVKVGIAYEREFERYLVRLFLERHPELVMRHLDTPEHQALPVEARLLALLSLSSHAAPEDIATLLPDLGRSPGAEELLKLTDALDNPVVASALQKTLSNETQSVASLEALLTARNRLDASKLAPLLTDVTRKLLAGDPSQISLGVKLVSGFRLRELDRELVALAERQAGQKNALAAPLIATLKALSESGSAETALFEKLVETSPSADIRDEALMALAASSSPAAPATTLKLWSYVTPARQRLLLDRLATTAEASRAIVQAVQDETLPRELLDANLLERMSALLPGDATLKKLSAEMASLSRAVLLLNGEENAWASTPLKLDGPLTVESWVRLDPEGRKPGNRDGFFGVPGKLDINFYDGRLRVYGYELGDVVISSKPITTGSWTHVAATRSSAGIWTLYLDGEPVGVSERNMTSVIDQPHIGWSTAQGGTHGALTGYRVWNLERTGDEIRHSFDRDLPGNTPGLVFNPAAGQQWGRLEKGASITSTMDVPPLLSAEAAVKLDAKFARYRALAEKPGDIVAGRSMAALCMGCHLINGQGVNMGPNLSGVGAMGTEAILRNILTPNVAMESAYRIYRVEKKDGSMMEGFHAGEDAEAVILRRVSVEDERIPRSTIKRAQFLRRSLMPEGLLDALPDQSVSDLMEYLKSLK